LVAAKTKTAKVGIHGVKNMSDARYRKANNQVLRGHYAYYGIGGNVRALQRVHRFLDLILRGISEPPEICSV
jgi:Uri superfamily endonuclease